MSLTFNSAKKRAKKTPTVFTLDGEEYKFTPPKTTGIWLTADGTTNDQLRAQLNWLSAGLSDQQAQHLQDRLLDLDDPLEVATLVQIVGGLLEEVSGRPTGPSPG